MPVTYLIMPPVTSLMGAYIQLSDNISYVKSEMSQRPKIVSVQRFTFSILDRLVLHLVQQPFHGTRHLPPGGAKLKRIPSGLVFTAGE